MTAANPRHPVQPVHVVGLGTTAFLPEHDAMLDELVFAAVSVAFREAGLRKQDVGLSVTASMDVLDGRSISNGLTNAAAAGYLNDSFRLEGDSGVAVLAALEAVASGDVEVAVAVGVHNPETRSADGYVGPRFLRQVSNLAFEPHVDRPVGLTADAIYALQASLAIQRDGVDLFGLAQLSADEINRGAGGSRAQRAGGIRAQDVLGSDPIAWPLSELMLPAHSTGAVAVVLASPARAARCVGRDARIIGSGHASGGDTSSGPWLDDPAATSRRAAAAAYGQAGIVGSDAVLGEVSAPTPALHQLYLDALGLPVSAVVNASGGLRSNYPGLANGALRLAEAIEGLAGRSRGEIAVSHSLDTITGTVSEDVTVSVVEAT